MLRLSQNTCSAISQGGQLDQKAGTTSGFVLVPLFETISDIQNQLAAASYAVSHSIYIPTNSAVSETWQIAGVSVRYGTASTSGTLQVEVAGATIAIGSGVNQLTGTIDLSTTDNTTKNGTLVATPTVFGAGSAINLIYAGTVTNLLNAVVSIDLQRVS